MVLIFAVATFAKKTNADARLMKPGSIDFSGLEKTIEAEHKVTQTPGAAVAIVSNDKIIFAKDGKLFFKEDGKDFE